MTVAQAPPAPSALQGPDEADEPIRFEINPQPAANALILRQFGILYDHVGLRLTERDKDDWILALDLLIEAALMRVAARFPAT
jgi:hypothetical protein